MPFASSVGKLLLKPPVTGEGKDSACQSSGKYMAGFYSGRLNLGRERGLWCNWTLALGLIGVTHKQISSPVTALQASSAPPITSIPLVSPRELLLDIYPCKGRDGAVVQLLVY